MARLLIVDDDPYVLRLQRKILSNRGHEVITADNGQHALDLFHNNDVDAILVDLRLPGMDGLEIIEAIRSSRDDVPIIVVSAASTKDDITRALRAGCYDYVEKPILDVDRFCTTVERAVEQHQLRMRELRYLEELRTSHQQQQRQLHQLQMLHEVAAAWQSTFDERHLLRMVLTCATSGRALGYNRAHVFLLTPDKRELRGALAVGPTSGEEAGQIWSQLADRTLAEQLEMSRTEEYDNPLSQAISQVSIPITDTDELVAACVRERSAFVLHNAQHNPQVDRTFAQAIRADSFACAPLIARDEVLGVLIVDNMFSNRPLDEGDLQILSTFANQAALALSTAQNYQRLQTHMTQMQRMQEQLIESERLAAVGGVAAHVAHEIRNPLFAIRGYARRLTNAFPRDSREAEVARIIIEEAQRLGQILSRVLEYLQKSGSNLTSVDLNEIILTAAESMRESIDAHRVTLTFHLEDLPPVEVDTRLMAQVIVKLILHALASTGPSGHLDIRTHLEDELIRMDVQDDGDGIPPERLEQIFNPFYTDPITGEGTSLAVIQKIIHSFGGNVKAVSDVNTGTVMTTYLPPAHLKKQQEATLTAPSPDNAAEPVEEPSSRENP